MNGLEMRLSAGAEQRVRVVAGVHALWQKRNCTLAVRALDAYPIRVFVFDHKHL